MCESQLLVYRDMHFTNVQNITNWRLCLGCGTCSSICPEDKIRIIDRMSEGMRPILDETPCGTCHDCVNVCPGLKQEVTYDRDNSGSIKSLQKGWGNILEIWEGYAADPEIRLKGSSGGAITALALYCIEKEKYEGVIHAGVDDPLHNGTKLSRDRNELLASVGSRYSPASPGQGLKKCAKDQGTWAMIGKPCDIAGLRNAQKFCPDKIKNIGVAISLFCAGTPSTQGTLDLLSKMNIPADHIRSIRYRGNGWPGKFCVSVNGNDKNAELSYEEAWGFLQKYRPYRCHLCPDGVGEQADISCGDPWYRQIKDDIEGYSLILVRTDSGKKILHDAIKHGCIIAEQVGSEILEKSQPNLFGKRAAVWGRLLAFKIFALPAPRYNGFPLFENWMTLPPLEKARSVLGTMRRIIKRKYYKQLIRATTS